MSTVPHLKLTRMEADCLAAARDGRLVECGEGDHLSAAFLRHVLVHADALGVDGRGVRVTGGHITGELDLESATLLRPLVLHHCAFEAPISLRYARGESVRLTGSQVRGIDATQLELRGDLSLNHGFSCRGAVALIGAVLGGDLDMRDGALVNEDGAALVGDRMTVGGSVLLGAGFEATGTVALNGATISGQLECRGGRFVNPGSRALQGSGISVANGVYLNGRSDGRFEADGEVRLVGARVQGPVACSGGRFHNPGGRALNLSGAVIAGDLHLRGAHPDHRARIPDDYGFEAYGEVRLIFATISGQLDCTGGVFDNPGGRAFNAFRLTVAHPVFWKPARAPAGQVTFAYARVGTFFDERRSWSATELILDGFVYESLEPLPPAPERIAWLERQAHYAPSSYEQLITAYKAVGRDSDARRVAIAKQERHRGELRGLERAWNWLLGRTIAHGYQSWRALAGLGLMFLTGWAVFASAFNAGVMLVVSDHPPPDPAPAIYALDVLLPIVDLRQEFWVPDAGRPYGLWYLIWFWCSIGVGWILTTLLVGGLTGVLRRE